MGRHQRIDYRQDGGPLPLQKGVERSIRGVGLGVNETTRAPEYLHLHLRGENEPLFFNKESTIRLWESLVDFRQQYPGFFERDAK
jgi:hypothetical protein